MLKGFEKRILEIMNRKGKSFSDLAKLPVFYGQKPEGLAATVAYNSPTKSTRMKWAKALGVKVEELE